MSDTIALHTAIIKGDIEKTRKLLSRGANVNATDPVGFTPLHYACARAVFHEEGGMAP